MTDNESPTPEQAADQLEAAWTTAPNHTRELAEQLLCSGQVNDQTTLADVKTILEEYNAISK
jgi:hypothetical protein